LIPAAPTDTIAAKFGGTSLADAAQIRKVAAIVRADPRRRYIVVSAPGKRHKDDQKVTDLLLTCWHLAAQRLHYQEPLGLVRERYAQIARELDVAPLDEPVAELEGELRKLASGDESTLATRDWIAARGEYFHARLIADFLGAIFVPAGECIRFTAEGRLDPVSYANWPSAWPNRTACTSSLAFTGVTPRGASRRFRAAGPTSPARWSRARSGRPCTKLDRCVGPAHGRPARGRKSAPHRRSDLSGVARVGLHGRDRAP
jgi:aspartate kinase